MKAAEKLYNELVETYEVYLAASEAEREALERHKAVWQSYLKETDIAIDETQTGTIPDYAIVQDGDRLYEIKFDLEDYHTPVVSRIDRWAVLYRKATP